MLFRSRHTYNFIVCRTDLLDYQANSNDFDNSKSVHVEYTHSTIRSLNSRSSLSPVRWLNLGVGTTASLVLCRLVVRDENKNK